GGRRGRRRLGRVRRERHSVGHAARALPSRPDRGALDDDPSRLRDAEGAAGMKLSVSAGPLTDVNGDVLVLERYLGEPRPTAEAAQVDRALDGLLARALADERFGGRLGETTHLHANGRLAVKRVVVVGLGRRAECTPETVRRAAAAALRRSRDLGAARVVTPLLGVRAPARTRAQALGEGALL